MAASLLAAVMSTVSGALNSIGTLISYDLLKRWRPEVSDRALISVGRWSSFVAMVLAIGWSLTLNPDGIFQAVNAMITYLAPPMTCVFLFGVFWRRASAIAATSTLLVGAACGLTLFVLNQLQPPAWASFVELNRLDFLLQGILLFFICSTIMMLVSLRWPQQHTAQSAALVWSSLWEPLASPGWPGLADYKFVSALLILVLVTIYYVLR
jgi:SSS family solute:Na+ symporter